MRIRAPSAWPSTSNTFKSRVASPRPTTATFTASPRNRSLRRERQACVHMSAERAALIPQEPSRLPSPEDPRGRGSLLRVLSGRSVQLLPPPCPAADHHLAHRTFDRACQAACAAATPHPPWFCDAAEAVLAASLASGLEEVVGTPLASRYHPGRRPYWIKVKNVRRQEVTGGWRPGQSRRAKTIGSLLLGSTTKAIARTPLVSRRCG